MGPERKAVWKCAACRDKKAASTPETTKSVVSLEPEGETTLKSLETLMRKQFANLEKKMDDKFKGFEESLDFMSDKFDKISESMKNLEQKTVLMEKNLEKAESENKELKKRVRDMEVQMNIWEQKQYSNKMEIAGIKNAQVNEKEVMVRIIREVQLESDTNIQYRVEKIVKPAKDNREGSTTLVVTFNNQTNRDTVLTKIKERKVYNKPSAILGNAGSGPIFIHECLSPYYKKLFYEANRLKKDKNYSFLWVKKGQILLKKTESSKLEILNCMDDLRKM